MQLTQFKKSRFVCLFVFGICLLRKGNKGENNCDYIKLISFFTVKETINQIKRKQLNRSTYIL